MGIGKRIKEARENKNLTQKDLGELVGVTASAITNYENETSHPKEPILYKLIKVLQVDANFLFQDVVDLGNKKTPSPEDEGVKSEVMDALNRLSPQEQEEVLQFALFRLMQREEPPK